MALNQIGTKMYTYKNVQLLITEHCYENKIHSQDLNLDNKCFQQL